MTVSVVEAATQPLLESLRMQRLHAVLGRCSLRPLEGELRQEVLFTQSACLLVHARVPRPARAAKLTDFSGFRWIAPPGDSPTWQAILAAYSAANLAPPRPELETASTKLVHARVARDAATVAVLPRDVGEDLERLGGVRVIAFPGNFRMPPVGLMAQQRQWDFSHIAALRKTLRKLVATSAAAR
jgi:DNA-binding transcriptional LysR family regulator